MKLLPKLSFALLFISSLVFSQTKFQPLSKFDSLDTHSTPVAILLSAKWCSVCRVQKAEIEKKTSWSEKELLLFELPLDYPDPIVFKGKNYRYFPSGPKAGYHELALMFLQNTPPQSPTWIFISGKREIKPPVTGFIETRALLQLAQ